MTRSNSELDGLRSGRSEVENHYIDELVNGNLNRRDFLRRGSTIGMSAPLLGAILAACGASSPATSTGSKTTTAAPATKGGSLRIASTAPAAAVNPLTVSDAGGLCMLNQTGEFLVFDSQPGPRAPADARAQLVAEQGRERVDVQAAARRQVPQRAGDDARPTSSTPSSSCRTRRTPPTRCPPSPVC